MSLLGTQIPPMWSDNPTNHAGLFARSVPTNPARMCAMANPSVATHTGLPVENSAPTISRQRSERDNSSVGSAGLGHASSGAAGSR